MSPLIEAKYRQADVMLLNGCESNIQSARILCEEKSSADIVKSKPILVSNPVKISERKMKKAYLTTCPERYIIHSYLRLESDYSCDKNDGLGQNGEQTDSKLLPIEYFHPVFD